MENDNKQNPLIQGDGSAISVRDLQSNVDNHTDSHDVVNNNTVVYNGAAAAEKLLSERRDEYRAFCRRNIVSRVINRATRLELNEMAQRLGLSASDAEEIEKTVLAHFDTGQLSAADRVTLDLAIEAVRTDTAGDMADKLAALADKTEDEQVQFYANLVLAAYNPAKCVQRYEQHSFDSYWQTFWSYLAYRRSGNNQKAETVLDRLAAWHDYPEDQITLLNGAGCLYGYFACNGSDTLKKTAIGYLNHCASLSDMLSGFVAALLYVCGEQRPLHYSGRPEVDVYLRLFGAREKKTATVSARPFSIPDTPVAAPAKAEIVTPRRENPPSPAPAPAPAPRTSAPAVSPAATPVVAEKSSSWKVIAVIAGVAVAAAFFLFRSGDEKVSDAAANEVETAAVSTVEENKVQELTPAPKTDSPKQQLKTSQPSAKSNSAAPAPKVSDAKESEAVAVVKEQPVVIPAEPKVSRLDQLSAKASSGDAAAACELGQIYLDGDGVKKSNKTAFTYFRQSAELGNAEGMYMTGWCYRMGRGTSKNLDLAKEWWTKAAAKGHSRAIRDVKEFDTLM